MTAALRFDPIRLPPVCEDLRKEVRAFLAANLAMIGFAIGIGRYGLLLQQTGFMFTSLLGIYRAGFLRVERSKP